MGVCGNYVGFALGEVDNGAVYTVHASAGHQAYVELAGSLAHLCCRVLVVGIGLSNQHAVVLAQLVE